MVTQLALDDCFCDHHRLRAGISFQSPPRGGWYLRFKGKRIAGPFAEMHEAERVANERFPVTACRFARRQTGKRRGRK